jgi:serine/threonine-protein kinase
MLTAVDSKDRPRRSAQARRVIEDCMARRESGEELSDAQIIAENPGLMPELERELRVLAVIERAVASGRALTPPGPARARTRLDTAGAFVDESIDGYEIIREVHRGSQGVVFEAVQEATGRRVAIKVRRDGLFGDPRIADRFQREVEILASLDHPSIVGVIDSGLRFGKFYYVMDFVEGVTLDRYTETARPGVEQTLRLFEKIATAVNAAHLRGIIHRDLKPANILVDPYGEPRLLDFGLARLARTEAAADSGSGSTHLTQTGQFVGSLPWTSPEQARGVAARIDLRTDVYSLGVILFQMLTGKLPYEVENEVQAAAKTIGEAAIPRPSRVRKGVGEDIDTIIAKCLQKEPSVRYQSAGELAAEVRRYLEHKPVAAQPTGRVAQARAFIRRNRLLVAINLLVVAVLLAATVVMAVRIMELRRGSPAPVSPPVPRQAGPLDG